MVETTLPLTALQAAFYGRLTAHAATSGHTVYDASAVPLDAAFPYLTLQVVTSDEDQSKSTAAAETLVIVKAHTRSQAGKPAGGGASFSAAYDMADDCTQALTSSALTLGSGHTLIIARAPSAVPRSYTEGGHTYREVVLRFRYRTQYTG